MTHISVADPIHRRWTRSLADAARSDARAKSVGVALLCIVPFTDALIDQLHNALHLTIGPLTLPQAVRGLEMVVAWILIEEARPTVLSQRIRFATKLIPLIFACATLHEAIVADHMFPRSLTACFQILYWCSMWMLAARCVTTPRQARRVLLAFAFGGAITAVSVYWGYLTGARLTEAYHDVRASAGLYSSGKSIAGILSASAFIFAYLSASLERRTLLLLSGACAVASYLTYARAGMVGMALAIAWVSAWSLLQARSSRWARRLVLLLALSGAIVVTTIGTRDFERRWSDLSQGQQAGSGRVELWTVALTAFSNAPLSQQLFGRGIEGMYSLMHSRVLHDGLHTHSDLFDLLTVTGAIGLVYLLALPFSIFRLGRVLSSSSPGFGLYWSLVSILTAGSLLTGIVFLPDTMTFLLVTLTATAAHGGGAHASLRSSDRTIVPAIAALAS